MRVKRFVGENITDTMNKVKRDLGVDAVIIQTRKIKEGGFLGFFAKTKVEITAVVEEKTAVSKRESVRDNGAKMSPDFVKKAYETFSQKDNEQFKGSFFNKETDAAHIDLKQMHIMLEEIKGHIVKDDGEKQSFSRPMERYYLLLKEKGLSEELIQYLLGNAASYLREDLLEKDEIVIEDLRKQIIKICSNTDTIRPVGHKTMVVALIGPTGVGKTTTIGKLAAGFSIIDKRRVALVTADTYRVAAVEQLRTFGEIIGVPVEVAMTPEGLQDAIQRHADKELIFVDTAGRSPHHELHMSELREFLAKASPDITMLVMSVTTNTDDQAEVLERFKNYSTHLILTKLDESTRLGSILDLVTKTTLPIAYLTNGQNVPDDIEAATPEKLARCVLGEGKANV